MPQNAQSRIKTEQVGQTQNHHHYSPVNIYFGENFSVRLQQWFKFLALIENNSTGGIIHCHFTPNRKLATMNLSADGIKIRDVPNAGGSSVNSEVMSFEILQKCFKGKLLKTEMEVAYFPEGGSITDYVCEIYGTKVGVSVTRAMKFRGGAFTDEDAQHLLTKKLKGVIQSSRNTLENWTKQVLHVWSVSNDVTNTLIKVYEMLPTELRSNTVVLITTTTKTCDFIYLN